MNNYIDYIARGTWSTGKSAPFKSANTLYILRNNSGKIIMIVNPVITLPSNCCNSITWFIVNQWYINYSLEISNNSIIR